MRTTDTKQLKKIMIDKNIESISDLSDISGVSRPTLSKIMSGKALPSADTMERIATSLDISPEEAGNIFFAN